MYDADPKKHLARVLQFLATGRASDYLLALFQEARPDMHRKTYMKGVEKKKELPQRQREELLGALEARFEKNMSRHEGLEWDKVKARLEAGGERLWSLNEMERTGGEPDVVGHDKKTGEYIFVDCSAESPKGRTGFCYDREALDSRKEFKPKNNVMDVAAAMG
ncbi:MAG TPA: DUF4256 domain-containing protein, partial [Opitutaceae bacterium]|nr:DUF4256 domain-containing protein [Opitutaceae bacterium]